MRVGGSSASTRLVTASILLLASPATAAPQDLSRIRWQFVISHYKEQLDWLPRLLEETKLGEAASVFIYHKGGGNRSLLAYNANADNARYFDRRRGGRFNGTCAPPPSQTRLTHRPSAYL